MENFILIGSGTAEIHLPNWVRKSVFLTFPGLINASADIYPVISRLGHYPGLIDAGADIYPVISRLGHYLGLIDAGADIYHVISRLRHFRV